MYELKTYLLIIFEKKKKKKKNIRILKHEFHICDLDFIFKKVKKSDNLIKFDIYS